MDILSNFAETLNDLLFERNLTPETFAKEVCIDRSLVYRYMRKECLPSLTNFIKISDYLNCSTDFLLGLSPTDSCTGFKSAPKFSDSFKKILAENNLTRYALVKKSRFAQQSVDDWYHGKRTPNVENALDIAKYFNCSMDYLLGRE